MPTPAAVAGRRWLGEHGGRGRREPSVLATRVASLLAAVAVYTAFDGPLTFAGLAGRKVYRGASSRCEDSKVAQRVSAGGRGSQHMIALPRRKPPGFDLPNTLSSAEVAPSVPRYPLQQKRFVQLVNQNHSVSELFVRFEGKSPWKKVGRIVSATGDFEEAVVAQWPLLMERFYYLYKKLRFFLPQDTPVQFGYSNEMAEIVPVTREILPEVVDNTEYRAMLSRVGFFPDDKPWRWKPMTVVLKQKMRDSKRGWAKTKPHLLKRAENCKLSSLRNYNPHLYRGPYRAQFGRKQHGLVVGTKAPERTR